MSRSNTPNTFLPPKLPDLGPLIHEHTLLYLLFHRNKNQHRSSKWFKHFALLKRHVSKLLRLLEMSLVVSPPSSAIKTTTSTSTNHPKTLSKTEKKKLKRQLKLLQKDNDKEKEDVHERVHAEIRWLREFVIPNAYFAFTGLVCSNQFAGLGVVLLGVLARVYRVIGGGELGVSGDEEGEEKVDNDVEEREVMVNYDGYETSDLGVMIVRREQEVEVDVEERDTSREIFRRKSGGILMDEDGYGSPRKREDQSVPVRELSYIPRKGEDREAGSALSQKNEGIEGHLNKEKKFPFENAEEKAEIEVDLSINNNNAGTSGTAATPKTSSGSGLKKKNKKQKKKKRNEIDELFAGLL